MSVFIVGGDSLGNIRENLKGLGCDTITHLQGRKNICSRKLQIPSGTDLILIMTDFVDHNIAKSIRHHAKSKSIPVLFSKRSWTSLLPKIRHHIS